MPYGRPVSRKRRRRFQNGESRGTPWAAIAARKAAAAAAAAADIGSNPDSDGTVGLNPSLEVRKGTNSGSVVIAPSLDLLRPGYSTGIWPLRERLLLASSLLDTDNRQLTWPPISRRLSKFTPPSPSCGFNARPSTWCSAKACAKQYSLLLESAEMFRKQQVDVEKSAEEGRTVYQAPGNVAATTATVGLSLPEFIVKRLTVERIEELRTDVLETRKKHSLLKCMLERVRGGELDHCMDDIWVEIQRQEANKYKLSEHQQPLKTTLTETDDIKPEIPSHNPSTVERSENQSPPPTEEVVQFVNDLNSWQDPYDVPSTVWTVSSGLGANLRGMPPVAKVTTGPRRPGAVGRPRKRPLHPVRADLSNRLSMKSSKRSLATSELEIDEDESTSEAAEEDNESDVPSSASSTKCMTTSDAEEWPNMPESHFKQERRRQQEAMKLIKDRENVPMPRLTSPKRRSDPTSPVRTPPSCESSTEGLKIINTEEWPTMPESCISRERKHQRKVRKVMRSRRKYGVQMPSSAPDKGSTVLSPPHLTEEEESAPLADLAVKIKKSTSQSSQKQKKTEGGRIKNKPSEIPTSIVEEVPKKQEVLGASKKNRRKREDEEEKVDKPKKENSAKKKKVEEPDVIEPKVVEQLQQQEAVEEKMEVDEQGNTFQPRSLRLRLSRQDDGNLTVVDEKLPSPTQAQPVSKSPIKLRLSLSPAKAAETPTAVSVTTEVLAAAFPNVKFEDSDEIPLPLKKKFRTSTTNEPTEKELLLTSKSILTSAEAGAKEEVGKSASLRKIKKHFVHRVLKELTKPVFYEAPTSDAIPANVAQEVYNRLEPVLTNWVKECTGVNSEKSSKSSARKSMKKK
ncbi:unnamed protein product [Hymenolepis diminuta]|uniref:Uncharacterized protein n=1 Tax=Hymenolepis diminuta TaxID=6216 RepID=A0A564Y1M6_HYMDI|nr:unnamed protein product [Hymenolepis diminuta]